MSLKRYLLFAGERCYPLGGMEDFISYHDTLEEAIETFDKLYKDNLTVYSDFIARGYEWAHVFDALEFKIVKWFYRAYGKEDFKWHDNPE